MCALPSEGASGSLDTTYRSLVAMSIDDNMYDRFLDIALDRPQEFADSIEGRLRDATGSRRIEILRAGAVAHRELEDMARSAEMFDRALAEAEQQGDDQQSALVEMSAAATMLYSGDARGAVAASRMALGRLDPEHRFEGLVQLGGILARAGLPDTALATFDEALADDGSSHHLYALAELYNHRGTLHVYAGALGVGESDYLASVDIYRRLNNRSRAADMTHNLAWLVGRRGDLVRALDLFAEAAAEYQAVGRAPVQVLTDRCEALLAAGLLDEGAAILAEACAALAKLGSDAVRAEALVLSAEFNLRLARWEQAEADAFQAAALHRRSGKTAWAAHADLMRLSASFGTATANAGIFDELAEMRVRLRAGGLADPLLQVDIVEARARLEAGDTDIAAVLLSQITMKRVQPHVRPHVRVLRARLALAVGDSAAARREIRNGLASLESTRAELASSELRTTIGLHGVDVLRLDLQMALDDGRPWAVLRSAERGRSRALRYPPVRTSDDRLGNALTAMRALESDLASETDGERQRALQAQVRAATERVRTLGRHGRRQPSPVRPQPTLAEIQRAIGSATLVLLVDDGADLHAVTVAARSTQLHRLASADRVRSAVERLRRELTNLLMARGDARLRAEAPARVRAAANALDQLLGASLPVGDGPVVMIPTPDLHLAPWGALPRLAERSVTVAPSIVSWMAATMTPTERPHTALFVAGPSLVSAENEIDRLGHGHPAATLLTGSNATAARVLAELERVGRAHLACHGHFARDNPLMSTLQLADGPLYLYDLERCALPPTVVLSACHAGQDEHRHGIELMGFVSTLLSSNCRALVAPVTALPDDDRTVHAMQTLHDALDSGRSAASALRDVRVEEPEVGSALLAFGASVAPPRVMRP